LIRAYILTKTCGPILAQQLHIRITVMSSGFSIISNLLPPGPTISVGRSACTTQSNPQQPSWPAGASNIPTSAVTDNIGHSSTQNNTTDSHKNFSTAISKAQANAPPPKSKPHLAAHAKVESIANSQTKTKALKVQPLATINLAQIILAQQPTVAGKVPTENPGKNADNASQQQTDPETANSPIYDTAVPKSAKASSPQTQVPKPRANETAQPAPESAQPTDKPAQTAARPTDKPAQTAARPTTDKPAQTAAQPTDKPAQTTAQNQTAQKPVLQDTPNSAAANQQAPKTQEPLLTTAKQTTGKTSVAQHPSGGSQKLPADSKDSDTQQPGSPAPKPVPDGLNIEQVTVSANTTSKNSNLFSGKKDAQQSSKQGVSANSTPFPVSQQASAHTATAKVTNNTSPQSPFTDIGRQIQESIHSTVRQGENEITVRLNPPELGRVFIRFQQQDGDIVGLMQVTESRTRAEIQQLLPQMVQNLQDQGIGIKRIDVVPTNEQNNSAVKDQSMEPGSHNHTGGQDSTNPDTSRQTAQWTGFDQWQPAAEGYTELGQIQLGTGDDSINILV